MWSLLSYPLGRMLGCIAITHSWAVSRCMRYLLQNPYKRFTRTYSGILIFYSKWSEFCKLKRDNRSRVTKFKAFDLRQWVLKAKQFIITDEWRIQRISAGHAGLQVFEVVLAKDWCLTQHFVVAPTLSCSLSRWSKYKQVYFKAYHYMSRSILFEQVILIILEVN